MGGLSFDPREIDTAFLHSSFVSEAPQDAPERERSGVRMQRGPHLVAVSEADASGFYFPSEGNQRFQQQPASASGRTADSGSGCGGGNREAANTFTREARVDRADFYQFQQRNGFLPPPFYGGGSARGPHGSFHSAARGGAVRWGPGCAARPCRRRRGGGAPGSC